jgi:Putative Ig domain
MNIVFKQLALLVAGFALGVSLASAGTVSVSGTTIPSATKLVDAQGNTWTLSSSQTALENGSAAGFTSEVKLLLYFNGLIYQENTAGKWWSWASGAWTAASGDPRVTSASGAVIPPSAQIVDASGNIWTISSSETVLKNGAAAGFTDNVTLVLYYKGVIYQEKAAKDWWSWTNGAWTSVSGDPRGATPLQAPSALQYSTSSEVLTEGVAILSDVPSSSGGAISSYSSSPSLPAGLSLNTTSGVISGTPSVIAANAQYTITGKNSAGSASTILNIKVNAQAPSALTYSQGSLTLTKGTAMASIDTPSSHGGAIVSYSISSALPAGLSFNTTTGAISGTPTALSVNTPYLITATNSGGSTTETIDVAVDNVAPSKLAYTSPSLSLNVGTAMTNDVPSSSGGAVVSYSASPALPSGLTLNASTGVISGTPSTPSSQTNYSITAKNTGGSTSAALSITVVAQVVIPSQPLVQARSADDFVNSVGVNTHFDYTGTPYTTQTSQILSYLGQLGVRHIRDAMHYEDSPYYAIQNEIGTMGIKADYIMDSINQPLSQIAAFSAVVNNEESVEPANEYDTSGDANWGVDIKAQQTSLWNEVQSSLPGVTVLSPSLSQAYVATTLGNVAAIANVDNIHAYFGAYNPGNSGTNGAINPAYYISNESPVNMPGKPFWITETGYQSLQESLGSGGADTNGMSPSLQATYLMRTLFETTMAGAVRTYLYEFADAFSTTYWGLISNSGIPKPSFYAISSLLGLLSDPGTTFTPGSLNFSISGSTSNVQHMLFQKRDGSFYLALWVEVPGMNAATLANISVPQQSVEVLLGKMPTAVTSYQWNITATTSTTTTTVLAPSASIPVSVGQNVLILKIQ